MRYIATILLFLFSTNAFSQSLYSLEEEAYIDTLAAHIEGQEPAFEAWLKQEQETLLQPLQLSKYEDQITLYTKKLNSNNALPYSNTSLFNIQIPASTPYIDPFVAVQQQLLDGNMRLMQQMIDYQKISSGAL